MKKALKNDKPYWGNLSGIRGNIDDCDLTPEDREKGIRIQDLII